MARVLQWCCALFFVLITTFSSSECRRSGGGRRVSIRTYTYSKPKPSYRLPSKSSGVSAAKRYPGYPIHQGQGGAVAFPGEIGPGFGGFGRFGTWRHGYAGSHTFDSSTLWLSLYSLTRDVNHYHFYYPNSVPAKNIPERGSFSTQDGNMTCISIYNAKAVNKWATDTLNDLKKVFPQTQSPVTGNGTRQGFNFTVVPGEIVHNETLGVVCCGTAKGIVNLAVLTSGKDPDVNCMFKQFNMPFRKLKFIPIYSTFGNNTTSTATAIHPNSNNTTTRNFTVAEDSNSTTANTTVVSDSNSTTTNTTTISNSNNGTTANTTVISNSNNRTATNTTIALNSNYGTPANTTVISNSNNKTATNTTIISNPPISTKDNSTFNTASSTTAVPINAETHIQNIQMTTKAS